MSCWVKTGFHLPHCWYSRCVLGSLSFKRPVIKPDNNRKPSRRQQNASFSLCKLQDVDVRYYHLQNYLFHTRSLCLYVIYHLQTYVGNNLISVKDDQQRFLSVSVSYYICIPLSYTQRLEGVFIRVTIWVDYCPSIGFQGCTMKMSWK